MKTITIGLEGSLLDEINRRSKSSKMTRAEMIRNAVMEYLFRFDDMMDVKILDQAIEKNEPRVPLKDVAKKLSLR